MDNEYWQPIHLPRSMGELAAPHVVPQIKRKEPVSWRVPRVGIIVNEWKIIIGIPSIYYGCMGELTGPCRVPHIKQQASALTK